jgi:hypothetical protein
LIAFFYLRGLMAKIVCLNEKDRKLLFETQQKLDEATKMMTELMETLEVLNDPKMMKSIKRGQEDIKAGKVKELRALLKEEAS